MYGLDKPLRFKPAAVVFDKFPSGNLVKHAAKIACFIGTYIDAPTAHHTFFAVCERGIFLINGTGRTLRGTFATTVAFLFINIGVEGHSRCLFVWSVSFYSIKVKQAFANNFL